MTRAHSDAMEKKSFTGWMERPIWERTLLVMLILFCIVGALAVVTQ